MFELESLADMDEPDNRKDALSAFDRCSRDADFAAWARTYGRALAMSDGTITMQESIDEITKEANTFEGKIDELIFIITNAVERFDGIDLDVLEKTDRKEALEIISTLENAL